MWVKDPCEPKLSSLSSLFVVESWCVYVQNRLRRSHRCHDGRRTSTLHQPLLYGKLQVCLHFTDLIISDHSRSCGVSTPSSVNHFFAPHRTFLRTCENVLYKQNNQSHFNLGCDLLWVHFGLGRLELS